MSVAEAIAQRLAALRESLQARHGWTHLDVRAERDDSARCIRLRGEVAVDRLVARIVSMAEEAAPDWTIDGTALRPMAGGPWHALDGLVPLWAACPAVAPRRLATELRPEDGPVQRLGAVGDARVVRARDGTVGWLEAPLGLVVEPPRLPLPHGDDPLALIEAARPWIDTPYRLGGMTRAAIDCSALVQRLAIEVLGVQLPRHSSDQLLVAPHSGEGMAPGDLSFVWSEREALCHVGIVTGATVIHASLSRRRVVEDARADFREGSRLTMHVPFADLLAFGRQVAGAPSLTAAGFALGRPVGDPGVGC